MKMLTVKMEHPVSLPRAASVLDCCLQTPPTCERPLSPSLVLYPNCLQSFRHDLEPEEPLYSAFTLPTALALDLSDFSGDLWPLST